MELIVGGVCAVLFILILVSCLREADPPKRPKAAPDDRTKPTTRPPRYRPNSHNRPTARPAPPAYANTNSSHTLTGSAYVIDGDSLRVQKTELRLFGIDAPEFHHPYGKKAKWALFHLCKGQTIRADVIATDDHGRSVARCFLPDGRDLSAEMVKAGLAIDWPKFSGGRYRDLEVDNARRKMWLADARQKGHLHVWAKFDADQKAKTLQK